MVPLSVFRRRFYIRLSGDEVLVDGYLKLSVCVPLTRAKRYKLSTFEPPVWLCTLSDFRKSFFTEIYDSSIRVKHGGREKYRYEFTFNCLGTGVSRRVS